MQDYITLYDGKGAFLGRIREVIDAQYTDRITGELTLSFTTKINRIPAISADTLIEFKGQYFRAVQTQSSAADGAYLLSVSCEQESVALVDDEIELFEFEGTPQTGLLRLLSGTGVSAESEFTQEISVREENTNRRAVVLVIAGVCGAEIEYSGHAVRLVRHRGRSSPAGNLLDILDCTDVVKTADVRSGVESYEISGAKPEGISVGDEVYVTFGPLGIAAQKRIIGISYNPFNCTSVSIEVGDFVPDIIEGYSKAVEEAENAAERVEKVEESLSGYVKEETLDSTVSASFDKYVNSETGKASIVASLKGTYVSADTLGSYVQKTDLSAEIEAYVDTQAGTAKIVAKLTGTFVKTDALGNYVQKTDLSAEIGAYIDTQAGTAKIVNKLTGTFVKTDALGSYVQKTDLSAEIGAYIDTQAGTAKIVDKLTGTFAKTDALGNYVAKSDLSAGIESYIGTTTGKAKLVSAVSGTYQTISGMSVYAKTSAVTEIEQSVSDVEAAITMSSSYTKNTIGTNVYALLQLVSNANSSNIKIQADKIDFTGFTTFLRASDLGSSGSTSIDGGRIKTGTISADRIDTSSITLSDVYGKGTYASYLMITSSGHYMYIGSDITTTKGVYESIDIRSETLGFSNVSTRGLVMDHANKVFRPNSSSATGGYSLGTSTYQWNNLYVNKIYLGGKELTAGASMAGLSVTMGGSTSYYIVCNTSRELRPYSTSTTYPCYLGTSSYYWHYAYIGSNTVSIGSSGNSKLGFFGTTPAVRQTVSNSATVATLITALKKYGLIA